MKRYYAQPRTLTYSYHFDGRAWELREQGTRECVMSGTAQEVADWCVAHGLRRNQVGCPPRGVIARTLEAEGNE